LRILGIDFGFKRIGVAIGQTEAEVITPRPPLQASGALMTDAAAISKLARAEEVDSIVLGLPIEESGEEGRMARICRTLASHLTDLGETVHLVNEIYSSLEAENTLAQAGVKASQRKGRRDSEAAAVILERFFDGQES
jgi:putative Holliday junction resolvase